MSKLLSNNCIITGAVLEDLSQNRAVYGDLFKVGDTYVFNAVLDHGEALWQYGDEAGVPPRIPAHMKCLVLRSGFPQGGYFERRGVIVIHESCAFLNKPAVDYVAGAK